MISHGNRGQVFAAFAVRMSFVTAVSMRFHVCTCLSCPKATGQTGFGGFIELPGVCFDRIERAYSYSLKPMCLEYASTCLEYASTTQVPDKMLQTTFHNGLQHLTFMVVADGKLSEPMKHEGCAMLARIPSVHFETLPCERS